MRKLRFSFLTIAWMLILLMGVTGCDSTSKAETTEKQATSNTTTGEKQEIPVIVSGSTVRTGDLVKQIRTQGVAVCRRRQDVTAKVEGRVVGGVFETGAFVRKGASIVRIDDRRYRLQAEQAEASLSKAISELVVEQYDVGSETSGAFRKELAKLDAAYRDRKIDFDTYLSRSFDLRKQAVASGDLRREVALDTKGVSGARYQLAEANLNLENCDLIAPFDGVIAEMDAFSGRYVYPGDHLYDFLDPGAIFVRASLMETELPFVATGKQVGLRFSAYPDREFTGVLDEINPVVNPEDRTVSIFIQVDNAGRKIYDGMYADVTVDTVRIENQMLVPMSAVVTREGRTLVFVVDSESRTKWIYVRVVDRNDRMAAIISDSDYDEVREGDTVVAGNNLTLGHGSLVEVKRMMEF